MTLLPNPPSAELIGQYLAGELDEVTAHRVRAYLESTPQHRVAMAGIRASLRSDVSESAQAPKAQVDALLARMAEEGVHEHTGVAGEASPVHRGQGPRRMGVFSRRSTRPSIRGWTGAAIVGAVLLAVVGGAIVRMSSSTSYREPEHVYQTVAGQTMTVPLSDGSSVLLAPSTTLRIASRDGRREVRGDIRVDGEALFRVTPAARTPFVVRTSNAMIEVLGTVFAVRHYPSERSSRVVVEAGKVQIRPFTSGVNDHRGVVLTARMLGRVTDSTVTVSSGISTRSYTGWADGTLVFDWVALGDIVTELSRAYGAEIRIADSALAKEPLRLDVHVNASALPQVLDAIGAASNAHYIVDGRAFVLMPGRRERTAPSDRQGFRFPQPEKVYGR